MDNKVEKLLLTIREAGDLLRLRETALRKLVRAGRIRLVKVGGRSLVPRRDVDRFLAELLADR